MPAKAKETPKRLSAAEKRKAAKAKLLDTLKTVLKKSRKTKSKEFDELDEALASYQKDQKLTGNLAFLQELNAASSDESEHSESESDEEKKEKKAKAKKGKAKQDDDSESEEEIKEQAKPKKGSASNTMASTISKMALQSIDTLSAADFRDPFKLGAFLDRIVDLHKTVEDELLMKFISNKARGTPLQTIILNSKTKMTWKRFEKHCRKEILRSFLKPSDLDNDESQLQFAFQNAMSTHWNTAVPSLTPTETLNQFQGRIEQQLMYLERLYNVLGWTAPMGTEKIKVRWLIMKLPVDMRTRCVDSVNSLNVTCSDIIGRLQLHEDLMQQSDDKSNKSNSRPMTRVKPAVRQAVRANNVNIEVPTGHDLVVEGDESQENKTIVDQRDEDDGNDMSLQAVGMNTRCYNCQGYGHLSRDCSTPQQQQRQRHDSNQGGMRTRGYQGHRQGDGGTPQQNRNGYGRQSYGRSQPPATGSNRVPLQQGGHGFGRGDGRARGPSPMPQQVGAPAHDGLMRVAPPHLRGQIGDRPRE